MAVIFVTGPVRSGKSAFAVRLARESGLEVTYVATARHEPDDAEWRSRLARHLLDRPGEWRTVETAPMSHEKQLAFFREAPGSSCLLVDALGTWLAARMETRIDLLEVNYAVMEMQLDREGAEYVDAMLASPARIVAVSEQVGWDVVPIAPAARLFRDVMGRMAQRLARNCERSYLVVAGYALDLRASGIAIDQESPVQ